MPYKILDKVPEGWIETKGATHHPKGAKWYNNGKPRFGGEYDWALVMDKKGQEDER